MEGRGRRGEEAEERRGEGRRGGGRRGGEGEERRVGGRRKVRDSKMAKEKHHCEDDQRFEHG